jgi:hypothetical protein
MNEDVPRWRSRLFRFGLTGFAIEFVLYLAGVCCINVTEQLETKLRVAAWLFLIGTGLSLMVLVLSVFGSGWRRIGLAVTALLSLGFWYGFTLY